MRLRALLLAAAIVAGWGTSVNGASVVLSWTATGDDGYTGRAAAYDLRYSTEPLSASTWGQAVRVTGLPTPRPAGQRESVVVDGLDDGRTYFFGIRARDEAGNWSPLSNIVALGGCPFGCVGRRGNVDGDLSDLVDIADLLYLVEFFFGLPNGPAPACFEEADVDASGELDIMDVNRLANYLFRTGQSIPPEDCGLAG